MVVAGGTQLQRGCSLGNLADLLEGARVNLRVAKCLLGQDGPISHVGGVNLHNELSLGVRVDEDRSSGEPLLKLLKHPLLLLIPDKAGLDGSKGCQGSE